MGFNESVGQFYAPYWEWEDFKNGMYKKTMGGDAEQAVIMFTNKDICHDIMELVVMKWHIATKVNLTNRHSNRRAWLGQAASCMYANLTQEETCEVWKMLSDVERDQANEIAEQIIMEWEKENGRVY